MSGYWSCLVIGHVWLLVMSGYCSCLVIVHVWLLVMSGYWSCLVIGHVWLLVMSGYCSCLVIGHVWLLVMPGYWSCLVIVHVWLLVMPLLFNIGTFNFCILLLCSTCIYIYIYIGIVCFFLFSGYCPVYHDQILCWPETRAGSWVNLTCPNKLNEYEPCKLYTLC